MKRTKIRSIWTNISMTILAGLLFSGCFIFYGESLDGFSVDGIYDGSDRISLCTEATVGSRLQWSSDSFDNLPDDEENCGSIVYPISTDCFSADTTSGFNTFAFTSSRLSTWSDVTGYTFQVKTVIPGDIFLGSMVKMQPMLEIEKPDGRIVYHIMVDEDDRPIKFDVPNDASWHAYTYQRPAINPADEVIGLSVLAFIPNEIIDHLTQVEEARGPYAESRGFVYLDTVVPLTP